MIVELDLNNLKPNRYSDEGMNRLIRDILISANTDFVRANSSSKYCFKKAESLPEGNRKDAWIERGFGHANEIANVLYFIISDWYRVLTNGSSPQESIYNKYIAKTNDYVRDYVKEQVEIYAKRKNIDLTRLVK